MHYDDSPVAQIISFFLRSSSLPYDQLLPWPPFPGESQALLCGTDRLDILLDGCAEYFCQAFN